MWIWLHDFPHIKLAGVQAHLCSSSRSMPRRAAWPHRSRRMTTRYLLLSSATLCEGERGAVERVMRAREVDMQAGRGGGRALLGNSASP